MFIRDLEGNEYFLEGVINHEQELNGDERIDIEIEYTDMNSEFLSKQDDLKMWIILFEGKEYRIISSKQTGFGDKYRISVTAVLYMLDWLNSHRVYERIDASLTVTEAFNIVFNDTPFTYSTVESAPSNRFEGIGEGETRLEIFKTFIDRYGYEFKIVGNVVYLYNQIGNDANFEYRYKMNTQNIEKEVDASEMWTYARGYGNYSDDDSDTDVVEKAKLKREYTSPLSKIIGIREAPPIRDGRVTKQATMDANLKKTVDESVKISFTADIYDMSQQGYDYQHAVLGDRVFLVDERIGLDTEIRVVKITRNISSTGQILDLEITFGSGNMADQYGSNLSTAAKDIADLIQGRKSLPFQALDIISKSMVTKIQNTTSEIIYDTNGQHFMEKKNNNNIMTMNSSGLLLSTDGGKTAKTAITAEGIVADTITTGTLNANLISVRGGDNSKFVEIKNDEMTLFGTFKRTWQNNTATNNVFTRFKNGHLRFRNNDLDRSIYFSDFGISTYLDGDSSDASGTLEFFDYTYSGARGVTLNSGLGVVALRTDSNRILLDSHATVNIESKKSSVYIRPMKENKNGNNEFRFWVKDNLQADDTDGVLSYGSITTGSEFGSGIRFDKNKGTSFVYATNNNGDIGSGDFYARDLYGMLKAKADNQYIGVNGALRITDMKGYNGGNVNYKDLQVKDIQAGSIRTHDGNFYIGVSTNELRVTNNLLYNGGDIGYKPVRASDFNNASLEEYKENINEWNFDALSAINNETQLYSFNYKSDEKKETKYGLVIGEGYKTPSELTSGDGVNIYGMATWAFRAIQQLTKRVEELENGTTN
ncbi:phage tail spike protein [Staphylococcus haemolyticus]|uniref:phage tail spike protein n=1 Tax=Staphylococcus haemolyticus TaxID=1283 RepID=UPI001F18005D|nr:phage tail spike protein [Staphylococcus haemolyticus]MCE4993277.1 phage tail protein [Staphylococcus haemolyticus]